MSSVTFGPLASNFPGLFRPFVLGGHTLKNRFVVAPMTRGRSPGQVPNDLQREYYAQFVSSGLIISEGVHVSTQGCGWCDVPGLYTAEQTQKWKPVTQAVHEAGGIIFAQLWHQGRQSHSSFHPGEPIVSASNIPLKVANFHTANHDKAPAEIPHGLTVDEIKKTVQDFATAAKNAIEAGFDGVEIHSANGYLLDQFLQTVSNDRTDEYGGSIENRFRIVGEVIDACIAAVGKDKVGIRFSPNGMFGEMGSPDSSELFDYAISQAGKRGVVYVHVKDGLAFGFHQLGEPYTLERARKHLPKEIALIGCCGYTAESANAELLKGHADLIAFARPYIGNPDFPIRVSNGWALSENPPHHLWNQVNSTLPDYAPREGYIVPLYKPSS